MKLTREQQDAIRAAARHAAMPASITTLRANGKELAAADEDRAELLRAAVAREAVELELELLAYEQRKGTPNRNHVRFKDGAMKGLASSGKGTPFLRDHRQYDSTAIGGRVVDSKLEKIDGGAQIKQTVRLTEPAAVERALRGLMGAVSIGWLETGPIICTACRSEVFEECWHWPGAIITRDDGTEEVVEWEYSAAELVETSEVPIGGVPTAGIEGVRAALAAHHPGNPGHQQENIVMKNLASAIAAKLNLAATAGEEEILSAVDDLVAVRAELKLATTDRDRLAAENKVYREAERKTKADAFIRDALAAGKIAAGPDEEAWREMFAANEKRAGELMAAREPGCATPVGQPRQSEQPQPPTLAPGVPPISERQRKFNKQLGMTDEQYLANLTKGGN